MKYFFLSLLLLIVACGAPINYKPKKCVVSTTEIYGGTAVKEGQWSSAVALTSNRYGFPTQFCSGVLISRSVVLTAAHCLNEYLKPFEDNIQIYIGKGDSTTQPMGQYNIKHAIKHPKYTTTNKKDPYDYAVLVLEEEVTLDDFALIPPLQNQAETELAMQINNEVTIVGYGLTENRSSGHKFEVTTAITKVTQTELYIGGNGKDSCSGDSGGPAFMDITGEGDYRLIALTSRGGDVCGKGGIYSRIDVGIDWAEQELNTTFRHSLCP